MANSELTIKKGCKQTAVGIIPENWEFEKLEEIFSLKNGFAFSSEFFSEKGTIVLTPGNFKLDGGLYFNERNVKRYLGNYSQSMQFSNNDLLIVMTDLTADCNLLGKPAFVQHDEIILHNQRIGKVKLLRKDISDKFLFYIFLSSFYLSKIKETATGSTVRHTSNKSIYSILVPLPPLAEQQAIAEVLSDVDDLVTSLDALLTKKRNIKQGTMQLLLAGKKRLPNFSGDWETKKLGEIAEVVGGGTPSTFEDKFWDGNINWFTPTEIGKYKYTSESERKITKEGLAKSSANLLPKGTILLTTRAGIGDLSILLREGCTNQGFQSLIAKSIVNNEFLYYLVSTLKDTFIKNASGSTFLEISPNKIKRIEIGLPSIEEQKAIAQILSEMDAEIEALETRRDKYKAVKQGMMQELLTGKTRLNCEL